MCGDLQINVNFNRLIFSEVLKANLT